MTQYINKSALVAEMIRKINRCKKILLDIRTRQNKDYYQGMSEAYKEMISFLSTLEMNEVDTIHPIDDVVSNDPISKDLEEAAREISQKYFPDENNIFARPNYEAKAAENAFKEGAKWQKQQDQSTIELAEDHAYLAGQEKAIEKATSYIQQHWIWNTKMIEDFKKYMKGE